MPDKYYALLFLIVGVIGITDFSQWKTREFWTCATVAMVGAVQLLMLSKQ